MGRYVRTKKPFLVVDGSHRLSLMFAVRISKNLPVWSFKVCFECDETSVHRVPESTRGREKKYISRRRRARSTNAIKNERMVGNDEGTLTGENERKGCPIDIAKHQERAPDSCNMEGEVWVCCFGVWSIGRSGS